MKKNNRIIELIQDDSGMLSSIRVVAYILLLGYMGDWVSHIFRGVDFTPSISMIVTLLGAFGFKVAQKTIEVKKQ